jgi:isopropylmalate/homocitrate/citramalate synthase
LDENNMLYAALVSWTVTRVMDALLPTLAVVLKITWEKAMKLVKRVVRTAEMLVVNTICSAVIVVGVQLERLVRVARAVGLCSPMIGYKYAPLRGISPYDQLLLHS